MIQRTASREVRGGAFAAMLAMSSNTNQPGVLRVALAGAAPLRGLGALLLLTLPSGGGQRRADRERLHQRRGGASGRRSGGASFEQDADKDGQTDWAEVRAGTDAMDGNSVFAIKSAVVNEDGSKTLTWSSVAGRTYQVWCGDDAGGAGWQTRGRRSDSDGRQSNVGGSSSQRDFQAVLSGSACGIGGQVSSQLKLRSLWVCGPVRSVLLSVWPALAFAGAALADGNTVYFSILFPAGAPPPTRLFNK